ERKAQLDVECYSKCDVDGKVKYRVTPMTASALSDALVQVHDLVARYGEQQAYLDNQAITSPVYKPFLDAGIAFPLQPFNGMFQVAFWGHKFKTMDNLLKHIALCQFWA